MNIWLVLGIVTTVFLIGWMTFIIMLVREEFAEEEDQ